MQTLRNKIVEDNVIDFNIESTSGDTIIKFTRNLNGEPAGITIVPYSLIKKYKTIIYFELEDIVGMLKIITEKRDMRENFNYTLKIGKAIEFHILFSFSNNIGTVYLIKNGKKILWGVDIPSSDELDGLLECLKTLVGYTLEDNKPYKNDYNILNIICDNNSFMTLVHNKVENTFGRDYHLDCNIVDTAGFQYIIADALHETYSEIFDAKDLYLKMNMDKQSQLNNTIFKNIKNKANDYQ